MFYIQAFLFPSLIFYPINFFFYAILIKYTPVNLLIFTAYIFSNFQCDWKILMEI